MTSRLRTQDTVMSARVGMLHEEANALAETSRLGAARGDDRRGGASERAGGPGSQTRTRLGANSAPVAACAKPEGRLGMGQDACASR